MDAFDVIFSFLWLVEILVIPILQLIILHKIKKIETFQDRVIAVYRGGDE